MEKGYWIPKMRMIGDVGRFLTAGFECSACSKWTREKTPFCAYCGNQKEDAQQMDQPDEKISKRSAIKGIRDMVDIDGYPGGDVVSRRAAMAVIKALPPERGFYENH